MFNNSLEGWVSYSLFFSFHPEKRFDCGHFSCRSAHFSDSFFKSWWWDHFFRNCMDVEKLFYDRKFRSKRSSLRWIGRDGCIENSLTYLLNGMMMSADLNKIALNSSSGRGKMINLSDDHLLERKREFLIHYYAHYGHSNVEEYQFRLWSSAYVG